MLQTLVIIKYILEGLSVVLTFYASLSYSQKARKKYKILKFSDGKKHCILFLVIVLFFVTTCVGYYKDALEKSLLMNPATTKDFKDMKQSVEDGQQANKEMMNKAISEIKNSKWPLVGDWNLDRFNLMDQKLKIILLADQSMWYHSDSSSSYVSYQELWNLKQQDNALQSFVEDQLLNINSVLRLSNSAVARIPLCKNNRNIGNQCLEVETEVDFNVNNVIAQVSHPIYWVSRTKSAYLLHFLNFEMVGRYQASWAGVLDSLYTAFSGSNDIHKDNNLLTRYMAWESFRCHTCFADEKELFDVQKASVWWQNEDNKKKVLTALENGQKSPFCRN